MFTPVFQVAYLSVALAVFSGLAFLLRATARRVAGAAVSALAFTAMSGPIDSVGIGARWWSYPSCQDPPHPSLVVYLGQALLFVGCFALVAWRVHRRFGPRAVAVLTGITCVAGLFRDVFVAGLLPDVVRFGTPPASFLADLGAWAVVVGVALSVSRLVAGPPSADALRPRRPAVQP
jgi:hypothetical protein